MTVKTLRALSIRTKLTVLGLSLLIIPWLGYQYVQEIRDFLLNSQKDAQLLVANGVATVLHDRSELFNPTTGVQEVLGEKHDLYVHELPNAIQLDGQKKDWGDVIEEASYYTGETEFQCTAEDDPDKFALSSVMGYSSEDLYFLFEVDDDRLVFRDLELISLDSSDQIRMLMQLPGGRLRHFLLVARAPGRMSIYRVDEEWKMPLQGDPVTTFIAELAQTEWGYRVEMRIPRKIIGRSTRLGFFVVDVDSPETREIVATLATSPRQANRQTGQILLNSPELTKILKGLDRPQSRIWILDKQQRVRALVGGLSRPDQEPAIQNAERSFIGHQFVRIQSFVHRLLARPSEQFVDVSRDVTHRPEPVFTQVLNGEPIVQSRPSLDNRAQIIVAGYPIRSGEEILGAVVVEQSSNAIMAEQYSLLWNLTLLTILVFAFVMTMLVIFSWRLTSRVRKLHSTTERSITPEGRVIENQIPSRTYPQDELGDLGRSITNMLTRLSGYTRYLEGMPDTLAHELNNPLNVVSSSLEMLEKDRPDTRQSKYMERAKNGVQRLRSILTALTEAANLEDAMHGEAKERLDLASLVPEVVEGYNYSYRDHRFVLDVEPTPMLIEGNADHLAQMLDKLVDNALQYTSSDRPIIIRVRKRNDHAELMVLNEGPTIPDTIRKHVFDPMVSYGRTNAKQTHLGLGLFVVRLISEYHHGQATIDNRPDVDGVGVTVSIPMAA